MQCNKERSGADKISAEFFKELTYRAYGVVASNENVATPPRGAQKQVTAQFCDAKKTSQ